MGEHSTSVVDIGAYGLRQIAAGEGAPVLVLDDLLGPTGWGVFSAALASGHAVSLPTHPGYDGTPMPSWLDTMSDLANFYLDYLCARDLHGVHLVGLGLGGWIAADLATRNTSRLASLTLVNAGGIRVRGVPQCDIFLGGDDDALRQLIHDRGVADRVVAETITPEREDIRLQNQQILASLTWQPRLHDPHLAKWLHRIDIPACVIWSENNALFPAAYAQAWRDAIPGARMEMIAACGHLAQVEKPADLAARVSRFIAEQRDRA